MGRGHQYDVRPDRSSAVDIEAALQHRYADRLETSAGRRRRAKSLSDGSSTARRREPGGREHLQRATAIPCAKPLQISMFSGRAAVPRTRLR